MSDTRYDRGSVHAGLRQATSAAHRVLDHHPLLQRLLARNLDAGAYAESLAAIYRPHARLEGSVLRHPAAASCGLTLGSRLGLLAEDLSDMGWSPPVVEALPVDAGEDSAAWWGRLYVLEGSRLGSAVIARRVRAVLGEGVPCRFFGQAAMDFAPLSLFAALERVLEPKPALERAIASACLAFHEFRAGLDAFASVPAKRSHRVHYSPPA